MRTTILILKNQINLNNIRIITTKNGEIASIDCYVNNEPILFYNKMFTKTVDNNYDSKVKNITRSKICYVEDLKKLVELVEDEKIKFFFKEKINSHYNRKYILDLLLDILLELKEQEEKKNFILNNKEYIEKFLLNEKLNKNLEEKNTTKKIVKI